MVDLHLVALGLFAFLAGLVDSMVGGGGLIQLPALFIFLPGDLAGSLATVFGTNKFASICGTSTAVIQYARRVAIPWPSIGPAAIASFLLSLLGARTVSLLRSDLLKPVVLVLLVVVAVFTYAKKDLGNLHAPRFPATRERTYALLLGAVIGFYDGFFGPGTGSFLIFALIGWFGFDFLSASASAKVINFATNLSAVAYFAATDHILYRFAVPMAACNIAGSLVGTRLALARGNRFMRIFFLVVVGAMIAGYGWKWATGR